MVFGVIINFNQGVRSYITSAQPGHVAENLWMWVVVAQGGPNFLGKNAAGTKRDIAVNNRNF